MSNLAKMIKYGEIRSADARNYHNKNSKVTFTYLQHPITVDGVDYIVKMDIRKTDEVNNFYIHKITTVEAAANLYNKALRNRHSTVADNSISENQKNVNEKLKKGIKFSLNKSLDKQIDSVLDNTIDKETTHVYFGETPQKLVDILDIPKLPVLMTANHVYSVAVSEDKAKFDGRYNKNINYHNLGKEVLYDIPNELENPMMIIKSNNIKDNTDIVVVTNKVDKNGNQVIVAIKIKGRGYLNKKEVNANIVLSTYGKDDFYHYVEKAIEQKRVLYVNKNSQHKNIPGFQLPNNILNIDYSNSLSKYKNIVNEKSRDNIKFSLKNTNDLKKEQLNIVLSNNPATDDYHTWIRDVDDIKTFREAVFDDDYIYAYQEQSNYDDSYTYEMAEKALKTGKITVYSSKPITQGIFVTPSKMEAQSYSGNSKVYSKEVSLYDVAWIDATQGQYASVGNVDFSKNEIKFSLKENAKEAKQDKNALELNEILVDTIKGYTLDGYAISDTKIRELSRNILREYGTDKNEVK